MEACLGELKALRETAAEAKRLRQSAEQAKHESAKAFAMAKQAAESAAAHHEAAGRRWEALLQDSPFATAAEVEESYLSPSEAEELAAKVRQHREGERDLLAAIRHIEEQLAGSSLTEEEWLQVSGELAAAREADEEALRMKRGPSAIWRTSKSVTSVGRSSKSCACSANMRPKSLPNCNPACAATLLSNISPRSS
ncbi:hypothetical protein CM49_03793 [Paenibacillus sp. P1XP2]|nr:hypothetical protein CM49_03793 [Paenibacillus sp. P1XP2]